MMYQEDRAAARSLLGVNLVVEAGAGTGKTTLLIDRLCLAVLVQEIPVEKLVALTFTEKAAAEIKTRLSNMLRHLITVLHHEELAQAELEDREKKNPLFKLLVEEFGLKAASETFSYEMLLARAQAALNGLDRANVGTIHSFCADILKAYPLEAGIAPNAQIDSGQRAEHLFEARWNTFLDNELGLNAPRAEVWKRLLPEISLLDLKAFAQELCGGQVDFEHYDYYAHRDLLIEECISKAQRAEEMAESFSEGLKKLRKVENALPVAAEHLRRTVSFLQGGEVGPAPEGELECGSLVKGWDEESFELAKDICAFAKKVTVENQRLFLEAYGLVKDFVLAVREDYRQEGILSFDDLIVKTRDLLQHQKNVRRALKEKFKLLFIDEFQDTDPVQGELLLLLAEEKTTAADSLDEVRLTPGKLFVVGDPKQSIYRFRGADITAYESFVDLILKQGGKKCFLRQNHRSECEIISAVNEVCSRAMVQESRFQPAYEPIFTNKTQQQGAVEWLFVKQDEANAPVKKGAGRDENQAADDFRDNQAERIADWIEQHVGKLTLKNGKKLAYKDITLLTRDFTTVGPYSSALRRRGIAFSVETDKDFYRKQEVNDFLNFLRVVANVQDRTSLVGVLRSPLGGFTDEEIYQMGRRGELTLLAKPQDQKLADFYALINRFAQLAGRRALKDLLEDILEETFLPEACVAAYEGERTLDNLRRLVGLAEGYASDEPVSLGQFLADVQTLLEEKPERLGAPPTDDAQDTVSVMTIHKSKGLEAPVVILADISKKKSAATASAHIFSWRRRMHGFRVGPVCDINLAFLEEEQKKHERCEAIRVLYVALTRAREKLLLVADNRDGVLKSAAPFALAGLWPDGETLELTQAGLRVPVRYFSFVSPETFRYRHTPGAEQPGHAVDAASWRTAHNQRAARYQALLAKQNKQTPSELFSGGDLFSDEQRAGAELGTLCHRALEFLLNRKETVVSQAVSRAALQLGLSSRAAEGEALVTPFAQSALFQEILSDKLLACEMPFSFLTHEGSVASGVVDVVLEEPNGAVWIVDYKTDKVLPGQERGVLEQKYRPQLSVYKQAAEKLFPGKTVRCSAVFVRTFAAVDL